MKDYEVIDWALEITGTKDYYFRVRTFISGSILALDGNILGVDAWSKMNPRYKKYVKDAIEVSDESLEKIMELEPDLIIVPSASNNIEKIK